jgi:membrane-associated phospholipid phosphatase
MCRVHVRTLLAGALALSVAAAGPLATTELPAQAPAPSADTTRARPPLFQKQDVWIGLMFVAGAAAVSPLDKRFAEHLQRPGNQANQFFEDAASFFRFMGSPAPVIIGSSLYVVGRVSKQRDMADLGLHGTEAIAVGSGLTTVLKVAFGRARPDVKPRNPHNFKFGRGLHDDEYRSFPSGHSVAGFAAAATVTEETRRWWPGTQWYIGTVMYGGAALIGASRMYNNRHWASDVIIGAAIGTFAGQKVVRFHHKSHPDNRLDRWLLGVIAVPDGAGGARLAWTLVPN